MTKYKIFFPKWRIFIKKIPTFTFLVGIFFDIWSEIGELFLPNHEAHGQYYHLPWKKVAPVDVDIFTGNAFCIFSHWFLWFRLNYTNLCQKNLKLLSLFTLSIVRQSTSSFSTLPQKGINLKYCLLFWNNTRNKDVNGVAWLVPCF